MFQISGWKKWCHRRNKNQMQRPSLFVSISGRWEPASKPGFYIHRNLLLVVAVAVVCICWNDPHRTQTQWLWKIILILLYYKNRILLCYTDPQISEDTLLCRTATQEPVWLSTVTCTLLLFLFVLFFAVLRLLYTSRNPEKSTFVPSTPLLELGIGLGVKKVFANRMS